MRIVRFGERGREIYGLIDRQGQIRDLSSFVPIGSDIFSCLGEVSRPEEDSLQIVEGFARLGPCVDHVGKLICVGLNYVAHAAEANMELPKEPVLFMKATSSICGPYDNVVIPKGAEKVDWEVELGVIIGEKGAYIPEDHAMKHVAGYCVVNDISERSFQFEGTGQWVKGKSADSFAPIGPWFVTKDEIDNAQALNVWLEVNGVRMQSSNTKDMHFGVEHLVSYISRFMTLHPGDIICSGTPSGVGMGRTPPVYLKAGDVMRLGIDGLGVQSQNVVLWSPA